mgnify:FL=1
MPNWKKYKIDELKANVPNAIAIGPFGSRIKTEIFVSHGVPVIRGNNLKDSRFVDSDFVFVTEKKAEELKSSIAFPNDLIFTHRGTLGQVGIIPQNSKYKRYIVSQSQMKMTCDPKKVNPMFLYYFFKSPQGLHELLKNASGTGVPAIASPLTSLKSIEVPVPPISVQNRIVEILCSLDDKIELNRRMNETLEQMAMALYKHWFVDFGPFQDGEFVETELGLIPKGWTIQQLSDLVTIQTSSVNPAKNEERLFLHYSIPAYDERMLPVLEQGLEIKSNKYLIRKNSVLVSKLNPETYRIWTVYAESSQYERICSTEFIVYEPKKEIAWAFLNAYFRDESFKNEFRSHAAGTTGSRQRVTPRKTLEFKLVVPPDSILEQFNDMCSDYFKIQSKNIKENEMLTEIRDYLLPRLLSGEIEVGEAEEQVEEVLAHA